MGEKSAWLGVINFLRKRELTPMVAFCFSKKKARRAEMGMPGGPRCVTAQTDARR